MGRIVAVLNQKGGVGKTTVALGLASAAQVAGHRVLVVDLDPQGSSTWVLGVDPREVEESVADVMSRTPAARVIQPSDWGENVWVLPSSPTLLSRDHGGNPTRLRTALAEVADDYDVVLIDCPPSLGALTTAGLTAADHALIVVEPSELSLRGIAAVADLVDQVWDEHNPELELAGVVVNRVPPVSAEADRRYDELTRIVGKKAVWQPVIPQRVIVNQALGERTPIHGYGARAADVAEVFDKLWVKLRKLISG
ncbi:MAG: ParA family protein [Actinomycetota bacterium]|nr:ParA family protein [Actinomycetota bacterium]